MKKFIEIMKKDYESENFTAKEWLLYGVIIPLAFVCATLIAGVIERL